MEDKDYKLLAIILGVAFTVAVVFLSYMRIKYDNVFLYDIKPELYEHQGNYYEIKRVNEVILKDGKVYRFTVQKYMEVQAERNKNAE